jgi:hypothetical protein
MARYVTHPAARSLLAGGVVAGILGAFVMHAFLFAVGMVRYPLTYEWIASGVIGHAAYVDHVAWLGVIVHVGIAIVAATLYAYAAQFSGLLGKPLLGALLFGIVTNGVMDVIAFAKGLAPSPTMLTWHDLGIGLAAHVVFFALPIALFLSRYERVPVPYV